MSQGLNASITRIKFRNDEIYAKLNSFQKEYVDTSNYDNDNNDTIVSSYLILLSVGSDWSKIVKLATSIQQSSDEYQIEELHNEFYNLTKLYFDEFKFEILMSTGLA